MWLPFSPCCFSLSDRPSERRFSRLSQSVAQRSLSLGACAFYRLDLLSEAFRPPPSWARVDVFIKDRERGNDSSPCLCYGNIWTPPGSLTFYYRLSKTTVSKQGQICCSHLFCNVWIICICVLVLRDKRIVKSSASPLVFLQDADFDRGDPARCFELNTELYSK